jgi:hypothetical protein
VAYQKSVQLRLMLLDTIQKMNNYFLEKEKNIKTLQQGTINKNNQTIKQTSVKELKLKGNWK